MAIKQIVTVLLLLFMTPAFAANMTATFFCANTSALNQTVNYFDPTGELVIGHETRSLPCAWGCQGGECLTGEALALNAAVVLSIFWALAALALLVAMSISSEDYGAVKSVAFAFGVFMVIAGIMAALNVYQQTVNIGADINNAFIVAVNQTPGALALLFVAFLIYWLIGKVTERIEEKGTGGLFG